MKCLGSSRIAFPCLLLALGIPAAHQAPSPPPPPQAALPFQWHHDIIWGLVRSWLPSDPVWPLCFHCYGVLSGYFMAEIVNLSFSVSKYVILKTNVGSSVGLKALSCID